VTKNLENFLELNKALALVSSVICSLVTSVVASGSSSCFFVWILNYLFLQLDLSIGGLFYIDKARQSCDY